MGIEPTRDPCGPHTGFEDQGRHQTPVASEIALLRDILTFPLGTVSLAKPKPTRAQKPRPDFPLFPHAAGDWVKKVKGRLHDFSKVAANPKGQAALDLWVLQEERFLTNGGDPLY